jgi:hypothetical protein
MMKQESKRFLKPCRTCGVEIHWIIIDGRPNLCYWAEDSGTKHLCPDDRNPNFIPRIENTIRPKDIKVSELILVSSQDFKRLEQRVIDLTALVQDLLERRCK